jgi:hypothetical protein
MNNKEEVKLINKRKNFEVNSIPYLFISKTGSP